MSRRTIANAARVLVPVKDQTSIAVYVPAAPHDPRPNRFFLARHGEDVTKSTTERLRCSRRVSRASRKAKKMGRKLHNVNAAR